MIEHVDRIDLINDSALLSQPVPIWMFNQRIDQINHAIDQIQLLIDLATETPYTETGNT